MLKFKLLFVALALCSNAWSVEHNLPYNLDRPDEIVKLPHILKEISGIAHLKNNEFACIQDEKGIVFVYDESKNEIVHEYPLLPDGDYESIARVADDLFVLRSDATLFRISNFLKGKFKVDSIKTGIPARDNEGLCYDKNNNRLLIAAKGRIGKGAENKDKRVIYAFDIPTMKLNANPLYEFDAAEINKFADSINFDKKVKKNKKGNHKKLDLKIMTSEICINPITKQLYMLSAADHVLFVVGKNGEIENIIKLDPILFNKAEGLAFFENGDMLISNEGEAHKATILMFKFQK